MGIYNGRQNNTSISNQFGQDRDKMYRPKGGTWSGRYRHEGFDLNGEKGHEVRAEVSGDLIFSDYNKDYGNCVIIKTILQEYIPDLLGKSVAKGELFSLYAHLFKINVKKSVDKFITSETLLGFMGNSGNCFTKQNGKYRQVTEEEANDVNFTGGTHLHLSFYTGDVGMVDFIYKEVKPVLAFKNEYDYWFKQWGRYYINPLVIYKFFDMIKDK